MHKRHGWFIIDDRVYVTEELLLVLLCFRVGLLNCYPVDHCDAKDSKGVFQYFVMLDRNSLLRENVLSNVWQLH